MPYVPIITEVAVAGYIVHQHRKKKREKAAANAAAQAGTQSRGSLQSESWSALGFGDSKSYYQPDGGPKRYEVALNLQGNGGGRCPAGYGQGQMAQSDRQFYPQFSQQQTLQQQYPQQCHHAQLAGNQAPQQSWFGSGSPAASAQRSQQNTFYVHQDNRNSVFLQPGQGRHSGG